MARSYLFGRISLGLSISMHISTGNRASVVHFGPTKMHVASSVHFSQHSSDETQEWKEKHKTIKYAKGQRRHQQPKLLILSSSFRILMVRSSAIVFFRFSMHSAALRRSGFPVTSLLENLY